MNYIRNNFKDGDILYAETLNNMDNGIYRLSAILNSLPEWVLASSKPKYTIEEIEGAITETTVQNTINNTVSKVGLTGLYSDLIGAPQISGDDIDFSAYALKTDLDNYYLKKDPLVKTISTINGGIKTGVVSITAADLGAVKASDLATVATSGSYLDLTDLPSNYVERSELKDISFTGNYRDLIYAPIFLDDIWIKEKYERSELSLMPTAGNEYTLYIVTNNGVSKYYRWNGSVYEEINNMLVTSSYTTNNRFKVLEDLTQRLDESVSTINDQLSNLNNNTTLVIDPTFKNEGQAADAKLTGERLNIVEEYIAVHSGSNQKVYLTQEVADALYIKSDSVGGVTYKNCEFLTETYPGSNVYELSSQIVITQYGEQNITKLIDNFSYDHTFNGSQINFTARTLYDLAANTSLFLNTEVENRKEADKNILDPNYFASYGTGSSWNISSTVQTSKILSILGTIDEYTGISNENNTANSYILKIRQDIGSLAGDQVRLSITGVSMPNLVFKIFFYDEYNNIITFNTKKVFEIKENELIKIPDNAISFNILYDKFYNGAIITDFTFSLWAKDVLQHEALFLKNADELYIENESINLLDLKKQSEEFFAYSFYSVMLNNSWLWPDKIKNMIPADRVTFLGEYIKSFYNGGYWDRTQVEQAVAFGYITEELKNQILN